MEIAGRATFREQIQLSIDEAWRHFGVGNGVDSSLSLSAKAREVLSSEESELNCLVLDQVEILAEGLRPQITTMEFPPSIMNCKFFTPGSMPLIEGHFGSPATLGDWVDRGVGVPFDPANVSTARAQALRSICARRGQTRFRQALITAYNGCCCISGETTSSVLEAAHIHPYRGEDTNQPTNGLLLRSDWHTLFDLGLWTVDEMFAVKIASPLESSSYGELAGHRIALPAHRTSRPSQAALRYHRDNIFQARLS